MSLRRVAILLLALSPATVLTGCLIGGHSNMETEGTYVGPETISQVQPGKSSDYVVALLGEPNTKTQLQDGTELWKWRYVERKTSSGALLFVFGASNTTEKHQNAFVELREGVVQRAWRD